MNMQNGTFQWPIHSPSLPSSLAASQKGPWSTGVGPVGYQASLTDLFLKKSQLQLNSGLSSQLVSASSYLEKMSSFSSAAPPSAHSEPPGQGASSGSHPHGTHKCPHDSKDKSYPCELCHHQYSNLMPASSSKAHLVDHGGAGPSTSRMPSASNESPIDHKTIATHHMVSHLAPAPGPSGLGSSLVSHQATALPHHSQPPRRDSSGSGMSTASNRPRNANNKQFLCPVCNRCFTQKGNLKTHMLIHSGEKPYSCQICGKSFTQKGNVDTHTKIHTGEKDYNCHSCGKRFTQKGNLKTHVRSVHTKEKPYVCSMCGKSFSQKGNMVTHHRTHNKDDRFPCTLCGKTFSQKGNLKTHMQRHSGQLPARRYGPRRQAGHSRLAVHSAAAPTFPSASHSLDPRTIKSHLKSIEDEQSASPIEIALAHQHNQPGAHSGQQHSSSLADVDALSSSHSALKLAHASSREQQSVLESLHGTSAQHIHAHRNSTSPVAMQFGPARFYSSAPSLAAPLAHTASWLAAAGATAAGFGNKSHRGSATSPYDNFGLGSYAAGFPQAHPSSHLSRLGLLNSPPIGPLAVTEGEHKSSQPETTTASSSQQPPPPGSSHQPQQQYAQSTANPDFSQLLE